MSERRFELTRRGVLISLGATGIMSASAGMETTTHSRSRETLTDDRIAEQEFALSLVPVKTTVFRGGNGPQVDADLVRSMKGSDGVAGSTPIEITDATPGDLYNFRWDITVKETSGYVVIGGHSTDENGFDAGNVTPEALWGIGTKDELSTLGEKAEATLTTASGGRGNEYETYEMIHDDFGALLRRFANGILVSKNGGGAIKFDAGETVEVRLEIEIPARVGNEIQGAVSRLDLLFYAEQARHNDPDSARERAVSIE